MPDLGDPGSYLSLSEATPVLARDGEELGRVAHVLAAPELDVFDGLVVSLSAGSGGYRFVDADQVASIHERGVVLSIPAAAAEGLPDPSESPAALAATPDDTAEGELERKLRRAWEVISGKR